MPVSNVVLAMLLQLDTTGNGLASSRLYWVCPKNEKCKDHGEFHQLFFHVVRFGRFATFPDAKCKKTQKIARKCLFQTRKVEQCSTLIPDFYSLFRGVNTA